MIFGDMRAARPMRLVIVGGGFTGIALVIQAVRAATRPLDITVIEPDAGLGRGVAYGTTDPAHRINVPAARMGLFAGDTDQVTRWCFAAGILPDSGSDAGHGDFYVPRSVYGRFMRDVLRETLAAAGDRVVFRHSATRARRLIRDGDIWRVALDNEAAVEGDMVALCCGHAAPAPPCAVDAAVRANPKFVANPWGPDAYGQIGARDSVLIVGTGLTMADSVASLLDRGHAGPMTAISRRGLLPRGHGLFVSDLDILDSQRPPATALGLLRLVRQALRRLGPVSDWQAVLDSVRAQLPVLWGALPAPERRRVARRLLPYWEVHRFRISPQIGDMLAKAQASGRLKVERAALEGIAAEGSRFAVTLRQPGGLVTSRSYDAVVLCTGPEKNPRKDPFLGGVIADGWARLDDLESGLAVDPASRLLGLDGTPVPGLYAFGPLTRASFGEMTGAPDITRHLEGLASALFGGQGAG